MYVISSILHLNASTFGGEGDCGNDTQNQRESPSLTDHKSRPSHTNSAVVLTVFMQIRLSLHDSVVIPISPVLYIGKIGITSTHGSYYLSCVNLENKATLTLNY